MFQVKSIRKNKKVIIKSDFQTKEKAEEYINIFCKDEEAWAEEKVDTNIDFKDKINHWLFVESPKSKEFTVYGKLANLKKNFAIFQTKENSTMTEDKEITISTIKNMLEQKRAYFSEEGSFPDNK